MQKNGIGSANGVLDREQVAAVCDQAASSWNVDGKRLLAVIPDLTRTCPLDMLFPLLYERLAARVKTLDFLVALGTHPPLTDAQIYSRVGITAEEHRERFPKVRFFNHSWNDPRQLTEVGVLKRSEIREITDGLFEMDVTVTVNRMVRDYDQLIIVGPVFPHEVVGFSGGNKYIFPGIGGPEILNFFHWLGAVITNPKIIGSKWTPVRKVVDRAAAMLPLERRALCMVVRHGELAGLFHGIPEEAWSSAADLSRQIHVVYKDRPFHTVLSCAPAMYDEIWVAGKCMYKLEPVVADGGRLVIYAPHVKEISVEHGEVIREIGYHTRDFFLKQWDRYKHYPWGIVAHSTHVKGIGTFEDGTEKPRVEVVLATEIPEDVCREINLGFLDHREIEPADYEGREEEGILYVPSAGEILYRLEDPPEELAGAES